MISISLFLSFCAVGNIDQAQYCDRIKGIIELLGSKLSLDELSKIWKIQVIIHQLCAPSKLHELLTLILRNLLHKFLFE